VRDLQQLQQLQSAQNAPNVAATEAEAEQSVSDAARAAATTGNLPGDDSEKPLTDEEKKDLNTAIGNMDDFQFDAWRQAMMKDILNSPEQRELIESRLEPMDVADLISDGYIIQKVPIIEGKFVPAFVTTDGQTDLSLKRLIMEDSKSLDVSERYYLDKFALMSVAASLHSINGNAFPNHLDAEGNFDDELFRKKFNKVLKQPLHLLASLGINAFWFDARVRKLFVAEKLGNG
jgi:hypothetical protein